MKGMLKMNRQDMNRHLHMVLIAIAGLMLAGPLLAAVGKTVSADETLEADEPGDGSSFQSVIIQNGATLTLGGHVLSSKKFVRETNNDGTIIFDGGSIRYASSTPQVFERSGSGVFHLRGAANANIQIDSYWTSGTRLFFKTWSAQVSQAPLLSFEGDCDVVLGNASSSNTTNLRLESVNQTSGDKSAGGKDIAWNQTGDLIVNGSRLNVIVGNDNILPCGSQTGGIVIDNALAVLDLNGTANAINFLEVKSGVVTNSAETAATLKIGGSDGNADYSELIRAELKGAIGVEKIGSGTLTVDKGPIDALTVSSGSVQFAATEKTPFDRTIRVSTLTIDSPAMTTLIVDGVNVSCGALTGAMRDKLLVVTKNGGTFTCASMGDGDSVLRNSTLTAADTLVKGGSGTLTIVGDNTFAGSLSVQSGTVRFRAPYVTGGDKLMLRYTFKKTSGTNQKLMFEELRISGYNEQGTASANIFMPASDHATRYPIRASVADVWQSGGMWVSGTYAESTTGTNVPLPYTPDWLFDNGASDSRVYSPTDSIPVPGDTSTWQQIVARVYWWNSGKKIYGYNFAKGRFQKTVQGLPVTWTVEATTNGSDWSLIGEETDVTPADVGEFSRGWIGASDYPVIGFTPEKGFSPASCIRVDKDATLDLAGLADGERTISKIEIDQAFAGGKITDFVPAASGALYFVNVDGRPVPEVLLLAFDRIANAENLENWTVYVNGKQTNRKLYVSNGGLYLARSGLVFIVE